MAVYSGKQWEMYLALESGNMGTAETTNGNFVKLDVTNVSDLDWGSVTHEANLRTGQQVKKSTDHYVSQKGASYTVGFEWVVSHEQGLQHLLYLATDDSASAYEMAGNYTSGAYVHGSDPTPMLATVILVNPDATNDRLLTSCGLNELTLSLSSGSEGGRLVASGTFYTGYKPTIANSTVAPSGTQTAFVKTLYDCTTSTMDSNAVLVKDFSVTISNPLMRVGYQGGNADPSEYTRAGEVAITGSINCKYDANSDNTLADWLSGTAKNISLGDGASIDFDIPTAIYMGHNIDLGDSEEGVFVEVPFEATASSTGKAITIIAT